MAKTKNQQISHKGRGKYLVYKNSNRAELNKMSRIFDNQGVHELLVWAEKTNNNSLLKKFKKEKPSFEEALKKTNIIYLIKNVPVAAQILL